MKVMTQSFFTEGREKIGEEGIPDALIDETLKESFPGGHSFFSPAGKRASSFLTRRRKVGSRAGAK
jgi:hypothetical protein